MSFLSRNKPISFGQSSFLRKKGCYLLNLLAPDNKFYSVNNIKTKIDYHFKINSTGNVDFKNKNEIDQMATIYNSCFFKSNYINSLFDHNLPNNLFVELLYLDGFCLFFLPRLPVSEYHFIVLKICFNKTYDIHTLFKNIIECGTSGYYCLECKCLWVTKPLNSLIDNKTFLMIDHVNEPNLYDYPCLFATKKELNASREYKLGNILVTRKLIQTHIQNKYRYKWNIDQPLIKIEHPTGSCPICGDISLVFSPQVFLDFDIKFPESWNSIINSLPLF